MQGLVNFDKNVGKFKKKEKINSALTRRARCCRGGSRHERKGGMEAERIRKKEKKTGFKEKICKGRERRRHMSQTTSAKHEKHQRELSKWKQVAAKPTTAAYIVILVILVALVYIVDELTSNITSTVQSSVVNEFFVSNGVDFNTGLSNLSLMMMPAYVFYFILPFYKSLADKLGRKPFLVINTFGMAFAMFVIWISPNVYVYILGCLIIRFFIPNDMQVMYIMEAVPEKHRAKLCSITKACGYVGVASIPLLRQVMMQNDPTRWHEIFVVPVIMGVVVSILCIIFVKETPVFLNQRISYLENELAKEDQPAEAKKVEQQNKTGVFQAIRFIVTHKQLRYIAICAFIFACATAVTGYYESIMTTGGMATADVTKALFIFPLMNALFTMLGGFLTDRVGRKKSLATLSLISMAMLALFILSADMQMNPYLVGGFYGVFVGCFWSVSDLLFLMFPGESTPTKMRASVLGTLSLVLFAGGIVSTLLVSVAMRFVSSIGMLCMVICIPFMLISLLLVMFKVHETKGVNMDTVTGEEWE